ncbi:MAG TPA: hypothetical protein VMV46_11265 [Thermoanaerobaculia bacterium]|nr:hypothetical protein [Thermoanaerobaculia bacterium]
MTDVAIFGRTLRRRWWVPLLAAGVAVTAAAIGTTRQEAVYDAHATLVVTPSSQVTDTSDLLRSLDTLERRTIVATFARLASRAETRERAAARMGVEPGDLRGYSVRAAVVPNTNLIRVQVRGPEAEPVAGLADATAEVIRDEARRLYRVYSLHVVEAAVTPWRPVQPDLRRNLMVSAAVGLFFGALAAVALEAARAPARSLRETG